QGESGLAPARRHEQGAARAGLRGAGGARRGARAAGGLVARASQGAFRVIPIVRPVMDEREAEAARRVILSGWITQGPEVAAFEREFAAFVGAPHACAVSNCTTALHL